MSPPDWDQVKRLFTEALARDPARRRAWLTEACADDTLLFHEVAELLELHATDDLFLIPPDKLDSSTMESVLDRDLSLGTGGDVTRLGPLPRPGVVLAGRYRLEERVAAGASGAVYRATDELIRETVAVKVLRRGQDRESKAFRLEVATLRRVRLPGVVEILDENEDHGHAFIVMEWLEGRPFPGGFGPDWESLRDPALSLVEALERLHWAGVVHRDLKPDNVLVDADGRATITDLGIALETVWEEGRTIPVAGTPNYLAPELWTGGRPDERSDLYALGVMLFQALTGRRPHQGASLEALRRARIEETAPPVASLAPEAPPAVARVVDDLLRRARDERSQTASEVASRLRGRALEFIRPPKDGRAYSRAELAALFEGPDLILHLPSDAGEELWTRTRGDPPSVRTELDTWRRAGLVRQERGRFVIRRPRIDHLRALRRAEAGAARFDPDAMRREALELARELATRPDGVTGGNRIGEIANALSVLRHELERHADAVCDLLHALVAGELETVSRQGLDRLEYTFRRYHLDHPRFRDLRRMAAAAHAFTHGDRERALETLRFHAVDDRDDRLRTRLHGHHLYASRSNEHDRLILRILRGIRAGRTQDVLLRHWVNGQLGWRHYRAGRYRRAAKLHLRGVQPTAMTIQGVDRQVDAASALLEAGEFDRAHELAGAARDRAAAERVASTEARALWIGRSAAYRRGSPLEPDPELVAAIPRLEWPRLVAMLALTECAIAWRAGVDSTCASMAELAENAARRATFRPVELLCQCMRRAVAEEGATPVAWSWEPHELSALRPVGVAVQIAGLRAHVDPASRVELRAIGEDLAARIPRDRWSTRREILSVNEAIRLMSGSPLDPMVD